MSGDHPLAVARYSS